MNIYDYAMQMEKEGEALYKGFAKAAQEKGMKTIFTELADQENRHYKIFKKMKKNEFPEIAETDFLENVKGIFADWQRNRNKFNFKMSQPDLYRKALDIEQKSIDFYTGKANVVKDKRQKEILLVIAKEEKHHYAVIENIIDMIVKPERWVEHAEFSKIGEEY